MHNRKDGTRQPHEVPRGTHIPYSDKEIYSDFCEWSESRGCMAWDCGIKFCIIEGLSFLNIKIIIINSHAILIGSILK